MALSRNPTRTRTIEKAWLRDIRRRWATYSNSVVSQLHQKPLGFTINRTYEFDFTASQIRTYMSFVDKQINDILLNGGENWQAQYQLRSYQRALETTRAQLISQGADVVQTQEEILAGQALQPLSATPSLAIGSVASQPIHQDALQFLYTRSFDSLKGWTDALSRETRQILLDGVEQGQGIREVTRNIRDRIDVSRSRAELIARTETIQASQRGATNEAKRLEEDLDEVVQMRWISARDERVRHLHASWHGTLATPEQNFKRIQESPWNCRCAQVATLEDSITPKKQAKFKLERQALMALSAR